MPPNEQRYGASFPLEFPNLDPEAPVFPADARKLLEGARERVQTVGLIHNPENTAGIRANSGSALPASWTRYLDLAASGAGAFLKHEKLSLNIDGSATFSGKIDVTNPEISLAGLSNAWFVGEDQSLAHGMTSIVPTTVACVIGERDSSGPLGGMYIEAFASVANHPALVLNASVSGSPTDAPIRVQGFKKSGAARVSLADADPLVSFDSNLVIYHGGKIALQNKAALVTYDGVLSQTDTKGFFWVPKMSISGGTPPTPDPENGAALVYTHDINTNAVHFWIYMPDIASWVQIV